MDIEVNLSIKFDLSRYPDFRERLKFLRSIDADAYVEVTELLGRPIDLSKELAPPMEVIIVVPMGGVDAFLSSLRAICSGPLEQMIKLVGFTTKARFLDFL